MEKRINEIITDLTTEFTPAYVARKLDVSTALISTWKQKNNDFCPRLGVAAKLYRNFKIVVYPYSEYAVKTYGID